MNYNLLVEPWIPVLYADGKATRVSIKDVLAQAGRIRQIAASNPMDRVAVIRFLLAVLYWCKGSPPDDFDPIRSGPFPADWFGKLDANREYFDLFGHGRRFYQDPSAKRRRAATDLMQEVPTGNNFWHFRHSTDERDGLCPACCAMGLLRLPLFSVSGLPDLKSGINGTPPIYVIVLGSSLLRTLLANWTRCDALGEPAWVNPNVRPHPGQDVPLLVGLTMLSRRVWLHDPAPSRSCIACGAARTRAVVTCEYESAGGQKNDRWNDPHVVYLEGTPRKAMKAPDLTAAGKFKMDRPWPDLLARLLETGKVKAGGITTSLLIVGFATDQAKNIDVWERVIPVPSSSSHVMADSATPMLQWQKAGGGLTPSLARAVRPPEEMAHSRKHVEVPATIASVRPHVEAEVSAKAHDLLGASGVAWERAAEEYRPMMSAVARSLSPGFTTAAVERREQIARVKPDMRRRTDADKTPGPKKGGKK